MKTIYIVTGSTGEYSDYRDWFVRGFFDVDKARALRDELETKAKELDLYEGCRRPDYLAREALLKELAKLDEDAESDYTGITYFLQECRVDD